MQANESTQGILLHALRLCSLWKINKENPTASKYQVLILCELFLGVKAG
jgi:hypothetical protein